MSIFDASRVQMWRYSKQKSFVLSTSLHSATVKGLKTDHNQGIDLDTGRATNARNAHASIHEIELEEKGFPSSDIINAVINDNGKYYKIAQVMPNATTGLIVCILVDYRPKVTDNLGFTENKDNLGFTENENIGFTENE